MPINVYSVSGALRVYRVLFELSFKGLDYNIKSLEASKKEHKSPEYLTTHSRINASGLLSSCWIQITLNEILGLKKY
jgi:hypothetical protein